MVSRLLIIFFLSSVSAFADIVSDLGNISPEVSLCTEEDPLQACAVELCGPANQRQTNYLQEHNFERFLSKEGIAGVPKAKEAIQKLLEKKIAENKKIVDELLKKKADGTLIPDFNSLDENQWNSLATSVYQTHLGYNPFDEQEGPVKSRTPVSETVTRGLQDFAKKEATCSTKACREGVKNYLVEDLYGRKLEELKLKASNPKLLNERLPLCLSGYAATALKKNQQAKIQAALPAFYERYISTALSGYSDHSKDVFRKFIKEKLVIKYEAPSQTSADFMKELKEVSDKPAAARNDMEQMLFYRESRGMDPLADLKYTCPGSYMSAAGDAFLPEEGEDENTPTLFISLASQLDPANGEGILYHELTHALSHVFAEGGMSVSSTAEFKKMRECVKTLSPMDQDAANNVVKAHEGDHKCTEEDHADIVSYKAIGNKAGPLTECSLLKQTSDLTEYEQLDLNEKNSHSAKLVRILREAIHRNRTIPASCQSVIKKNTDRFVFKKCF